ncbi:Crp/Fnr family transcriptional regulator [Bacteroidota bacterium]
MPDVERAEVLKQSLIFSGLSGIELAELAALVVPRSFTSGQFVLWEGDAPEWFYLVAQGRVKVVKHTSSGKEFIIAFFGPGEMFGEVAVFEDKSYPASAQAIEDTRVLGIKKEDFLSFLANRPQVALRIINVLGGGASGMRKSVLRTWLGKEWNSDWLRPWSHCHPGMAQLCLSPGRR